MHGRQRVKISFGNGGWIRWIAASFPAPVFLRFELAPSGRLEPHEIYIDAGGPIDARALHSLPLGAIVRLVNGPGAREYVLPRLDIEGPDLAGQAAAFSTTEGKRRSQREDLRRLKVPGAAPYPDDFYQRVAAAFSAPFTAEQIAEAAGVPKSTVYRWVKEARRRGLLAAAKGGGT